jgi:hypothetical protein
VGNNYISQGELKKRFTYDPILGHLLFRTGLTRLGKCCGSKRIGKRCGSEVATGYSKTTISGTQLLIHRLIWILHNGDIPDSMIIDHIDGNRLNNRIENLRVCTSNENLFNSGLSAGNKSGAKGVYRRVLTSGLVRYTVKISVENKVFRLGHFNTLELASVAYNAAAKVLHGEYYRKT